MIALTNWNAIERLQARLGEEVEILATVGDIRQGDRGPKRVMLSRRMFQDFPLIFWEDDVFEASGIGRYRGEFVRVRGVVTSYTDRRSGREQLQIEVRDPTQVRLPSYTPPGKPGEVDEDPEFAPEDDVHAVDAPDDFEYERAPSSPAVDPAVDPESRSPQGSNRESTPESGPESGPESSPEPETSPESGPESGPIP
jgi:hypothetical protein